MQDLLCGFVCYDWMVAFLGRHGMSLVMNEFSIVVRFIGLCRRYEVFLIDILVPIRGIT